MSVPAEETTVFDRWTPITSTNNHRAILARAAVSCFRHERIDDISSDLMTLRRGVIWHFMQDPPSSFVPECRSPTIPSFGCDYINRNSLATEA